MALIGAIVIGSTELAALKTGRALFLATNKHRATEPAESLPINDQWEGKLRHWSGAKLVAHRKGPILEVPCQGCRKQRLALIL
jgi:hypothetical protein